MWWLQLLVRAFSAFVGLVLVRRGIWGLRGRPLVVPWRNPPLNPEVRGGNARFYGVLALFMALFCFLFVFVEPWVK